MSIITLTTDFGADSLYVAEMKAVILGICPDCQIIDVTHSIAAQDIQTAAYIVARTLKRFPNETIHVVVVDPGVGTHRQIVACRISTHVFVAPDNGVLSFIGDGAEQVAYRRVSNSDLWLGKISKTFHGRDIMAPLAAHLANGADFDSVGESIADIRSIKSQKPEVTEAAIRGTIVWVDAFGNLISNIPRYVVANTFGDKNLENLRVEIGDKAIHGVSSTYGVVDNDCVIALFGSNDSLEISVVNGNASQKLNRTQGDRVTIAKLK